MAQIEEATIESLRLPKANGADDERRDKAETILSTYRASPTITSLPDTLRDLLISIIKPLFSKQHPSLAPSGRKAHFGPAPTFPHAEPLVFDDSDKPWKLCFDNLTSPLLRSLLASYESLPPETLKSTIEQHIFLLAPALLNMIDDPSPNVKSTAFHLLQNLSHLVSTSRSSILHQSGLVQVFTTAIDTNLLLLPTLTPEDDSLQVLSALYPATFALIAAEFPNLPSTPTTFNPDPRTNEATRQKHLTHLLRHGILASLSHLNAGVATSHPALVTLLLRQKVPVLQMMGIYATWHLQKLIPLLRALLCEPFAMAAPEMMVAAAEAVGVLVRVCEVRVREVWWMEVLRGLVGGWCAVIDDAEEYEEVRYVGDASGSGEKKEKLLQVKKALKEATASLAGVVTVEEWEAAKKRLCEEERDLEGLFAVEVRG